MSRSLHQPRSLHVSTGITNLSANTRAGSSETTSKSCYRQHVKQYPRSRQPDLRSQTKRDRGRVEPVEQAQPAAVGDRGRGDDLARHAIRAAGRTDALEHGLITDVLHAAEGAVWGGNDRVGVDSAGGLRWQSEGRQRDRHRGGHQSATNS